jgi:hypothetical protein
VVLIQLFFALGLPEILSFDKTSVGTVSIEKAVVGTLFNHNTISRNCNVIGIPDSGKLMSDDNGCATLRDTLECLLYDLLRLWV